MKNRKNYPENWFDEIRPFVLKRDGYKCTNCKIKHRTVGYYDVLGKFIECDEHMQNWAKNNNYKLKKIHLQVAHLNQNVNDNSYSNLKAMCQTCHLNYDRYYNNILKKSKRHV